MRSIAALTILALVMLAGCTTPTRGPHDPEGGHKAWTEPDAAAWVVFSEGCGFCSGSDEHAEHRASVLYENGRVLWVAYGVGITDGPASFRVSERVSEHRGLLERLFADEDLYAEEPYYGGDTQNRTVVVHDVATSALEGRDRARVEAVLAKALARVSDPGPPDFSCVTDYGGEIVHVLGEPEWDVHLSFCRYGEWEPVVRQMGLLESWASQWPIGAAPDA